MSRTAQAVVAVAAAFALRAHGFSAPAASRLAPRGATKAAALADATLLVADAESAMAGVVGFLPFIAIPGVLFGLPFAAYKRLESVEGSDYTDTVFTSADPPRRAGQEESISNAEKNSLSYEELSDRYGTPGLNKEAGLGRGFEPEPEPAPEQSGGFQLPAFELPKFELPSFGEEAAAAPPPVAEFESEEGDEAPPPVAEEEGFKLPDIKLPWQ